jgi:hypothetical protein
MRSGNGSYGKALALELELAASFATPLLTGELPDTVSGVGESVKEKA